MVKSRLGCTCSRRDSSAVEVPFEPSTPRGEPHLPYPERAGDCRQSHVRDPLALVGRKVAEVRAVEGKLDHHVVVAEAAEVHLLQEGEVAEAGDQVTHSLTWVHVPRQVLVRRGRN